MGKLIEYLLTPDAMSGDVLVVKPIKEGQRYVRGYSNCANKHRYVPPRGR